MALLGMHSYVAQEHTALAACQPLPPPTHLHSAKHTSSEAPLRRCFLAMCPMCWCHETYAAVCSNQKLPPDVPAQHQAELDEPVQHSSPCVDDSVHRPRRMVVHNSENAA